MNYFICYLGHHGVRTALVGCILLLGTALMAEEVEVLEEAPAVPVPQDIAIHVQGAQPAEEDPLKTSFYMEANSLLRIKSYERLTTKLELWLAIHPGDKRAENLLLTTRIRQNEDRLRGVLKEASQLNNTLIDPEYLAAKTITNRYVARQLDVVEQLISAERHADGLRYLNEILLSDKNNQAALLMKDRLIESMLKIERKRLERERKIQREKAVHDIIKRGTFPDEKASVPRVYRIFTEDLHEQEREKLMLKLRVPLKGFNYREADLGSVLDQLFAIAGLNYIIYDQALGDETLTLSLQDETVESVLYTIQRMVGVRFNYHGGSVYVTSVDNPILVTEVVRLRSGLTNVLAQPNLVGMSGGGGGSAGGANSGRGGNQSGGRGRQQQIQQAAGGGAQGGAGGAGGGAGDNESDIERFIEKIEAGELTEWPDGSNIFLDKKSSTVMIRSSPSTISEFKRLLRSIDYTSEQILIEARFVEVSDTALKNLGVNWTALVNDVSSNSDRQIAGGISSGSTINPLAANPATLSQSLSGGSGFSAGIIGLGQDLVPNLAVQLSALEERGDANTLSEPKILTLNNMTGVIDIRSDISYISDVENRSLPTSINNNNGGVNNGASTNFAGVPRLSTDFEGINLTVVPSVATNGDIITLKISPVVRELVRMRSVPFLVSGAGDQGLSIERPEFSTRQISTTLHIRNGETVVLGGLIKERGQNDRSGVPGLSRARIIGGLFRNTKKSNTRSKLLIFVTATLIDPTGASYDEQVKRITDTANVVLPVEVQEIKAAQNKAARDQQTADIILDEIDPKRKRTRGRRGKRGQR